MNKLSIFSIAMLTILFFSCKDEEQKQSNNKQEPTETIDMHTSHNALDWAGVYKGELPCASCEAIKTTIVLKDDNTFERTEVYVSDKPDTISEKGSFTWDSIGSIITLQIKDEVNMPKYFVAEGSLKMLNSDGKENTGELASKYVLNKAE